MGFSTLMEQLIQVFLATPLMLFLSIIMEEVWDLPKYIY